MFVVVTLLMIDDVGDARRAPQGVTLAVLSQIV